MNNIQRRVLVVCGGLLLSAVGVSTRAQCSVAPFSVVATGEGYAAETTGFLLTEAITASEYSISGSPLTPFVIASIYDEGEPGGPTAIAPNLVIRQTSDALNISYPENVKQVTVHDLGGRRLAFAKSGETLSLAKSGLQMGQVVVTLWTADGRKASAKVVIKP